MAETLISPGVFLNENDLSQITQGPLAAGAALIGPTVTGPVNIPTYITSYSEYKAVFGASFISGGTTYEYLTSMAALNYFEQGGNSLLVTRVASGSYTHATSGISNVGARSTYTAELSELPLTDGDYFDVQLGAGTIYSFNTVTTLQPDVDPDYYVQVGTSDLATIYNIINKVNSVSSIVGLTAAISGTNSITFTATQMGVIGDTWTYDYDGAVNFSGGVDPDYAFELETLSVGNVMNNYYQGSVTGLLASGSSSNIRWEITASDTATGTFSLVIRRGDDYNNSKTVLETWNNMSLDPNQNNYIGYIIGDQTKTVSVDEFGNTYLQYSGSYANKSRYVRVSEVYKPTPNYFNPAGQVQSQYTASIPQVGTGPFDGAFNGALGDIWGTYGQAPLNMFTDIPSITADYSLPITNIQGVYGADYSQAISLLGNQDAYDFNVIFAPGLTNQNAPATINSLILLSQTRGDNISVVDMVGYGASMTETTTQATSYDNSYAATYWPWVQVRSRETGKLNFVPPSTLVPAIYEYNDKISAEWFAPAGLNRGGMSTVLQPERRLSVTDRNFLYTGKVNPIATFPGVGTVIYGQKTLQAKASALDRVNVRRLLISLKRYIKQISETLVFEPNTTITRNKFLNQVNPYLEFVQQKQGLYAFQVVMDETNNTPDVIDRNQLVGSIYLQPTRTAEFIQLDFNILPTGASFGA